MVNPALATPILWPTLCLRNDTDVAHTGGRSTKLLLHAMMYEHQRFWDTYRPDYKCDPCAREERLIKYV